MTDTTMSDATSHAQAILQLGHDDIALLHDIAVQGFGRIPDGAEERVRGLVEAGLVAERNGLVRLVEEAKDAHASWALVDGDEAARAALEEAHRQFLHLNRRVLEICTRWQLLPDGTANTHQDPAHDGVVLAALGELHADARGVIGALGRGCERLARYEGELEGVIEVLRGSPAEDWVAAPQRASYHTIWMRLHADLLLALGMSREDEAKLLP